LPLLEIARNLATDFCCRFWCKEERERERENGQRKNMEKKGNLRRPERATLHWQLYQMGAKGGELAGWKAIFGLEGKIKKEMRIKKIEKWTGWQK